MTDRDQLHHLADRARRGVLLPAEGALLADAVTELERRHQALQVAHVAAANQGGKDQAAIERVRKLATQWAVLRAYGGAAYELRKALDEKPAESAPLVHPDTEQQANGPEGADESALAQPQQATTTEAANRGCGCHNGDELCSGCRSCPDICRGCDGPNPTA